MADYNKKRNSYFLYDILVRKYVKTLAEGNVLSKVSLNVTQEYFGKDSVLGQERKIYEQILNVVKYDLSKEEMISVLKQCKEMFLKLDRERVFREQTRLLNKMSFLFGKNCLNEHVENYVLLANVWHYLNSDNIAESMVLEKKILEDLLAGVVQVQKKEVKNKPATMLESQEKTIKLFESDNPGFYMYLFDQLKEIKEVLLEHSVCSECEVCDVEMKSGIIKIYHKLEEFRKREFTENDIPLVLKVQDLVEDLKKKRS